MMSTAYPTVATGTTPDGETAPDTATPDARLAAAFGRHVARWSHERGASAAAAHLAGRAAIRVSLATSNGHSCMALDELLTAAGADAEPRRDLAMLRTQLLACKVVGTPEAPDALPLILDDQRLYLHRYYDYECRLARTLVARNAVPRGDAIDASSPAVVALLNRLFPADAHDPDAPDWQKIAVLTALLGRLTIISGGPGTGKTTAVVNLLACLLEADPACRIALTAPTGKAAARMTEVIRQRAGHLPDTLRTRLPTESSTIHRLLGSTPHGEFRHHAGNELPIDVLIVDEASMLDLALAVHLIEAVPAHARVILLGDKDQLAAVESGAVFAELSAQPVFSPERISTLARLCGLAPYELRAAPAEASTAPAAAGGDRRGDSGLTDCVIWLRRNYRFAPDSAIGLLATDTNDGHAARALARLGQSNDPSVRWINDSGAVPSARSAQAILGGYASYLESVRHHGSDPRALAAAFARFRVLCAVRDGPWGVNALNQQISNHFRRALRHPVDPGARSEWYPGRPVMVLRNDPVLQLFNGDIGIVSPDAQGAPQAWFPDDNDGFRAIAPVRLPEHETAFSMTVHKSQGSEFEEVLLVLPAEKSRILTRELLYTAVTRARQRLRIVATEAVIADAIQTATRRVSGLTARIMRPQR